MEDSDGTMYSKIDMVLFSMSALEKLVALHI